MTRIFTLKTASRAINYLKLLPLLTLFLFAVTESKAQASYKITVTLLKTPCNNDGIVVAQTTGVTPPYTLTWNVGYNTYTHTVTGDYDTLFNYSGGYVYVQGFGTMWQGFGSNNGASPFVYSISTHPAICPALGSAKATVSGGTAPYKIQWLLPGSSNVAGTGDSVNLPAGYYNILITDAHGCTFGSYAAPDSIYIYSISPVEFSVNTTPANCTNGTATITGPTGGQTPYSYQWSNGANTPSIKGLVMGNYTVTVTDGQGCSSSTYVQIDQAYTITVNTTPTNATCIQNNGSAIAFGSGGQSPYSYVWSTGQQTQTVSGLTGGEYGSYYNVNVTDAKGCIGQGYALIYSSTPITVTYSSTPSSCTAATGTATLNITGGTTPYIVKWYTYPTAQTTNTATGLAPGDYGFQVTDAVGCVRTGSVHVPPISVISASINKSDALCTQSNGAASAFITSGTAPFTYTWSTGSTTGGISGLSAGGYALTITDSKGCAVNKFAYVGTTSPITLSFSSTPASCIYATDGSITAIPTGGTAPYNYYWSNAQTTGTATALMQGQYFAYVSDAAGCTQYGYSTVQYDATNNNCYCTVSGKVFEDQNNNCTLDGSEPGIQNIMVHLNGFGYTFTDADGNYSFLAPAGDYTLSEDVQYYYPLASCQVNSISVHVTAASGCTITNNFANVINPIHDVSVLTTGYCPPPIPGNTYTQRVVVQNRGTITESKIHAAYSNDGQLSLDNFNPSLFNDQGGNYYNVISGFTSLAPGASQVIDVTYNVPTNIPLGTTVTYNDTVAYDTIPNWLNDYSPWNNVSAYQNTVVGSFDPNNKEVTPKGKDIPGYITTGDSMLTYTIHFQNTGTYPAQKVIVLDTLDSHLDITTLHPGYSNYNYSTTVNEQGVLKFTFNNINLPAKADNPQASIGMVSYTIRQKPNNAPGTQIISPASIYFDYNVPVRTNATLNTLYDPNSVKTVNQNVFNFAVYPNPVSAGKISLVIYTDVSNPASTVGIYNLVGQLMQAKTVSLNKGKNVVSTEVKDLPAGLYFVRVDEGSNSQVQKLSVIK